MKTMLLLAGLAVVLVGAWAPQLLAQGEESEGGEVAWVTDLEKALALAKAQNKDVLVNFSGSDWCGWCGKLANEVFTKPEFIEGASKNFILCVLDFPRRKPNPDKEKNEVFSKKYAIRGFPTILLLDAQGRVIGRTGYQRGGAEAYVAHINELRSRKDKRDLLLKTLGEATEPASQDAALQEIVKSFNEWKILSSYTDEIVSSVEKRIEKVEGDDAKAKELDRILGLLKGDKDGAQGSALLQFRSLLEKAVALDPENKLGLKLKYIGDIYLAATMQRDTEAADKYAAMVRELDPKNEHGHLEMAVINADIIPLLQQKKWGEAAIKAEDFIANMTPKKRGDELYYYAAIGRLQSGDKEKGKAHLNKLLELYPKSRIAPRAKKILQQVGG